MEDVSQMLYTLYKKPAKNYTKEDITILLTVPPIISQSLLSNRYNDDNSKKDIHENNAEYLKEAYNAACKLAKEYNWYEINCIENNNIRTIKDINDEIFNELKRHL